MLIKFSFISKMRFPFTCLLSFVYLKDEIFLLLQHPELLVASYSNNEESPHEPDGVALVWNTKFKKTSPEYIFHCQVYFVKD